MAHKKKRKRLNVRKLLVFILFFYLVGCGIFYILNEPIRNIIIDGTTYLEDYEIIEVAGIKDYPSIFTLNTSRLKKKIKQLEFVEDVKITRNLKFQLLINIKEAKAICEYDGNTYLSNGNYTDSKVIVGIPTLVNYVPKDTLNSFLSKMGEVSYDIIYSISDIEYSPDIGEDGRMLDEERYILNMNDGNIVYINTSNIVKGLKKYHKIYASLGDKKGILHLDKGNYLEVLDELQRRDEEDNQ